MNTSIPALQRLAALHNVAAAFVFNNDADILAREAPDRYTDKSLSQISHFILQITHDIQQQTSPLRDCRLTYENFLIWFRSFGKNRDHYLALFLGLGADFQTLEQPVNLAILNLEKVITSIEQQQNQQAAQRDIVRAAQQAELGLLLNPANDTNHFYTRLTLLIQNFTGPAGNDILLHTCHQLQTTLPIDTIEKMTQIIETCATHIPHQQLRQHFTTHATDLAERTILQKI
jgi:hypothetical protein